MAEENSNSPSSQPEPELPFELQAQFFWEKYKVMIVAGAVLVVVLFMVSVGNRYYQESRSREAAALLDQALQSDRPEMLAMVDQQFPGTKQAAQALFVLADEECRKGAFDKAAAVYDRLIQGYADYPMIGAAHYGKGFCLESQGKLDEAVATYRLQAQRMPEDFWTFQALLGLARLLETKGDRAGAKAAYESILSSAAAPSEIKRLASVGKTRLSVF